MSHELPIADPPSRCRHLQSKGMYINYNLAPGESIVGDGYVWCGMTAGMFGPDSGLCNPEECVRTDRSCYVPD
jgi:hypothetical protein